MFVCARARVFAHCLYDDWTQFPPGLITHCYGRPDVNVSIYEPRDSDGGNRKLRQSEMLAATGDPAWLAHRQLPFGMRFNESINL